MDPDPPLEILSSIFSIMLFSYSIPICIIILLLLLLGSALISGSEVAFFSLSSAEIQDLDEDIPAEKAITRLREKPRELLATILVANNLINIAIVIISDYLLRKSLSEGTLESWAEGLSSIIPLSTTASSNIISFTITVVLVTFLLLLFGEVAPKIYANIHNLKFSKMMARPLSGLNWLLKPISRILVKWSNRLENRLQSKHTTSREELDKAIELTVSQEQDAEEEVDILRGILKFGDVTTKQIMKSRMDVTAIDEETSYQEVLNIIKDQGFSRIPVFKEDFDNISGILYVKDLLGHTDEDDNFNWQDVVRSDILYIPESKKIDNLLKEFQKKRMHMAIVVDEYGGSAGIVTLEDIMEEVIGDIKDEFDEEEEVEYTKIDDSNYIFEGKTLLNDVARIIEEDTDVFNKVKGNSDSLAGLILELVGFIPKKNKEYIYDRFKFKIQAVNKRRIERIKLTILKRLEA